MHTGAVGMSLGPWDGSGPLAESSHRSEGEAERDIGSPCMIGLVLVVVEKFFRRRRRRRRRHLGVEPQKLGFCIKI